MTTLMSGGIWSCGLTGRNGDGNIVISGNIEMTQVDIAFKIPGRIVELSVAEGDRVTRGLLLAKLDTEQLEQQRNRDRAGLAAAEAVLPQLATSIEQRRAALAAEIEMRNAEVRQAEVMLEQLLSGSRRQQIEEAKAAAAQARAQFLQAELDWERAQTLYRNDDISTAQRDQFKARLDSTEAALRQADERLALVIEGPRSEEIEAARSRVAQARAALKLTETSRLEIRRLEQEIQVRRAEVDRARAQVALIEAQVQDAVALSPVSGVVLVKSAEVGEVVAAGTTVAVIGDMDRPWLRGYIAEPDLGRVKLGAKVRVTTDSYPGKDYWGRVTFIASEAEFTPKQIQTREERVRLVYRIKIEVDNPEQELKLNMPADAEILLDRPAG
ncbi:MAG: efflux RND transporter periplasmic adaptor subunit [Acidobacteriota bacterium]